MQNTNLISYETKQTAKRIARAATARIAKHLEEILLAGPELCERAEKAEQVKRDAERELTRITNELSDSLRFK